MYSKILVGGKKILGILLSLVMVLSLIPAMEVMADEPAKEAIAHYSMKLTDDNLALKDISGNGHDAVLSSAVSPSDFADGEWTLASNTGNNKYARLPLGMLDVDDENFTIEVQATVARAADQFLWALGTTTGNWPAPDNYIFVNPKSGSRMLAAIKATGTEVRFGGTLPNLTLDEYYMITMTSESGILKLYVDGELVATQTHTYSSQMSNILAGNGTDTLGYIGRSLYNPDSGYMGKIKDFKVYDSTLSAQEVAEKYQEANKNPNVAHYDMSLTDDNLALKDITGNGNDALLSSAVSTSDFADGEWTLASNGSNNKYASLPLGMLDVDNENFTIEVQATVNSSANKFLWVLGTTSGSWPTPNNYIFINPKTSEGGSLTNRMLAGIKATGTEVRFNSAGNPTTLPILTTGEYYMITMTSEGGILKLYVDGELVSTLNHTYSEQMSNILQGNGTDILGYIGRSLYTGDSGYVGKIKDFKVYDITLSAQEVAENYEETQVEEPEPVDVLELVDIPNASDIRGNITLPEEMNGVALTWSEVTTTGIVSLASETNTGYDATPAGVVTRQATDTPVTLRVSAPDDEGGTKSKDFELTIKAKAATPAESDWTGYLMAYFTGNGANQEQIYLAISEDGMRWTGLNDNQPVLESELGELGLRDPYLARSPEGDKFYLIATDLCIYRNGNWTRAQEAGSQSIMVWESTDLINWSEQRMVEVSAVIDAGCTWAPEYYYDEITGEYIVFWASKTPADGYAQQRVYYAKTRDFYTFTEPKVMVERGVTSASVIDTSIIKDGDTYYRFSKNEGANNLFLEKGTSILGEFTLIQNGIGSGVEGPSMFKFNKKDAPDADLWCLLMDRYGGNRYYPTLVSDLGDYSTYTTAPSSAYSMPVPNACHGSVVNLTTAEYDAIVSGYKEYVTEKSIYSATYVGELPAALPDTVAGVDENDDPTTYPVTWEVVTAAQFATAYDTVKVTGEARGVEITAYIEVLPKNLVYFIDSNGVLTNSPVYRAISDFARNSGSSLLNTIADQALDSEEWGYSSSRTITRRGTSVGAYDKYTTGYYSSNTSGTTITYSLPLDAGEYSLVAGLGNWWPSYSRTLRATLTYGTTTDTIGDYVLNATPVVHTDPDYTFTLAEPTTVQFTVTNIVGDAPTISWLSVASTTALTTVPKVTVNYVAGEGGSISGTAVQEVFIGADTSAVTATAEEGYVFVKWDDDQTDARRKDTYVQEGKTYTAIFERVEEPQPTPSVTPTPTVTVTPTPIVTVTPTPTPTVRPIQPSKVTLNKRKITLGVKEKFTLKATVAPKGAPKQVKWKSSKTSVATISSKGVIKAKKKGKTTITATTANGKKITCAVTVKRAPKKVTITTKKTSLKKGKTLKLKVKLPKNTASYKKTYTSSNKKVATISATGKITAKKKGTTTITVRTFNRKKAKIKITVK